MNFFREKGAILKICSDNQLKEIHTATLQVLEHVGITTNSSRILELFAKAGADMDRREKRIRLSPELVEQALGKTPERVKLCGRNRKNDMYWKTEGPILVSVERHRFILGIQ